LFFKFLIKSDDDNNDYNDKAETLILVILPVAPVARQGSLQTQMNDNVIDETLHRLFYDISEPTAFSGSVLNLAVANQLSMAIGSDGHEGIPRFECRLPLHSGGHRLSEPLRSYSSTSHQAEWKCRRSLQHYARITYTGGSTEAKDYTV
jgi:hypothetical protein